MQNRQRDKILLTEELRFPFVVQVVSTNHLWSCRGCMQMSSLCGEQQSSIVWRWFGSSSLWYLSSGPETPAKNIKNNDRCMERKTFLEPLSCYQPSYHSETWNIHSTPLESRILLPGENRKYIPWNLALLWHMHPSRDVVLIYRPAEMCLQ